MNWPKRTRLGVFRWAVLGCLVGSMLVWLVGVIALPFALALACVTILVPLWAGLFVYRGRLRRLALILAGVALVCAITMTIDMLAVQSSFADVCSDMGGHAKLWDNYQYICAGLPEPDTFYGSIMSSSIVSGLTFYTYLAVAAASFLNVLVLFWRFIRRYLH